MFCPEHTASLYVASQHSSEIILGGLNLRWPYGLMGAGPTDEGQWGGLRVPCGSGVPMSIQAWKPTQYHWSGQLRTLKYPDHGLEEKKWVCVAISTWPHQSLPQLNRRGLNRGQSEWGHQSRGPRAEPVLPWFNKDNPTLQSNLLNTYSLESLLGITDKSEFSFFLSSHPP